MTTYWPSLLGGMLIGLSVAMLMLLNGRVAGIGGIAAGMFRRPGSRILENGLFVACLLLGPVLHAALFGNSPAVRIEGGLPLLALAGLLVGFGSRLGSGCTSGHGVAGLGRLSPRAMARWRSFLPWRC